LKVLVASVKEKYDLRLAPFASNYYESSTSCVLFTSHEYVVNVIFFFWCVLLIELNEWEDEWFVGIQALQEGKILMKLEEEDFKKWCSLWANHQDLQIGCNWNGQNLKNHENWFIKKINHKNFPFFNVVLKHVQNITLDFKFYVIQRFNILVKSIACQ